MDEAANRQGRLAGWILLGSTIVSIAMMSQHPSSLDAGPVVPVVHGGLQAMTLMQLAAVVVISGRVGWSIVTILSVVALAAGVAAGTAAATINGFVVPALEPSGEIGAEIGKFAWEANQALARYGVVAVGSSIALLSWALWNRDWRRIAMAGFVIGLGSSLAIISGHADMHLHGAMAIYAAQWVWMFGLGWASAKWL